MSTLASFQDKFHHQEQSVTESSVWIDHVIHKVITELGWFASQQWKGATDKELPLFKKDNLN